MSLNPKRPSPWIRNKFQIAGVGLSALLKEHLQEPLQGDVLGGHRRNFLPLSKYLTQIMQVLGAMLRAMTGLVELGGEERSPLWGRM